MANILGVNLPKKKRVCFGLTKIYGIGKVTASVICEKLEIEPSLRVRNLDNRQIARITNLIKQDYYIGSDLRKIKSDSVKRLVEIGSYRGVRHRMGLPLRGQRTSTNGKTQKRLAQKHRRG